MNVETLVNEVKTRVEPIFEQTQELVITGFETLKSANAIVVETVQTLVKTHVEAGKDLFTATQDSFEKARIDGIKAVAADPIAYLPQSKERLLSAYNDTVAVVTQSGDELVKTFKQGYAAISSKLAGEPEVVRKTKRVVKKAASKARKTARAAA